MTAETNFCQNWSEIPQTGFLASRLIVFVVFVVVVVVVVYLMILEECYTNNVFDNLVVCQLNMSGMT